MSILSPVLKNGEAERLKPWGVEPKRLWSLWDMLRVDGVAFYEAVAALAHLRGVLQERGVLENDLEELFNAPMRTPPIDDVGIRLFKEDAQKLKLAISVLGTRCTILSVNRFIQNLDSHPTYATIKHSYREIHERLQDELGFAHLLTLTEQDKLYFEPDVPLFGADVQTKFPSILYDVEEAGKCLALDRSTASAFHSIRCLEAGVRAIYRCLGIADPTKGSERNWGHALRLVKAELERRWPSSSVLSGVGEFLWEIHAALSAMQNPWRNATMHLDRKYTLEEAKHIFDVVNGFMRKLASRCDEDGNPKV